MCDETLNHLLTPEECSSIVENYAKEKNVQLISYQIKSLSDKIEGLLGEHYIITTKYKTTLETSQSFFMKVLSGSPVIFELSQSINAYEKEKFFYEYLRKQFKELMIDVSYSPEDYFCKQYKLVLENLALRGFKNADKNALFDVHHCEIALKCLAKFHASGIIYEQLKKKKLNDDFSDLLDDVLFGKKENLATQWFRCSMDGLLQLIQHLNISDEDRTKFSAKLLQLYKKDMINIKESCANHQSSILHGDLWNNNILFDYKEGLPKEGILIDFQVIHYGPVSVDVVQMLLTNTRKDLRDLHYNSLLRYYYEQLDECVRKNNCALDSDLDEFLESCRMINPVIKLKAVADRSITFMSDDVFPDALKDNDGFRRFLFQDRSKHIINSFLTNEYFREIIEEDMLEFMELLLFS